MTRLDDFLNRLRQDKKSLLLVGIFAVLLLYLDISFLLKPQITRKQQVASRVANLRQDLATLKNDLSGVEQLKNSSSAEGNKNFNIVEEEQLSWVLEEISRIANDSGGRIVQIKPLKNARQGEVLSSEGIKLLPVTLIIDMLSGYHALGIFINGLENSDQFISVQEMKVTANATGSSSHNVNLVLKTYVK